MMLTRLRRTTGPRCSLHENHLRFGWQVHLEAALCNWKNDRARRSVANDLRESDALALEVRLAPLQRSQLHAFLVTIASPCNHGSRNNNECDKAACHQPAAPLQPSFRHARSRALLARGLCAISASEAVIAFLVIPFPSAWPRHVHTG